VKDSNDVIGRLMSVPLLHSHDDLRLRVDRGLRIVALDVAVLGLEDAALAGCVSASSLGPEYVYMESQYGKTPRDGEVTTTSGQDYSVFMHRSKSELIVSVNPKRAYRMGFARGLTLGMAQEMIPREEFEAAARKWFDQIGRPGCRTTGGRSLNAYYFEFHHNCGPWRGSRP
jgi:hypothetical protein